MRTFIDKMIDDFYGAAPISINYGDVYNPSTHELVPKKEFIDAEIKRKEEALEANDRAKESSLKYYESVRQRLLEEKEKLVALKQKRK
jgi:hypothetical protein